MESTIENALLALANMDADGARLRNDVGFNGADSSFGRSLAFQLRKGKTLSDRQRAAAWRMLGKYRTQLEGYGIRYADIPVPEQKPKVTVTAEATLKGEVVVVRFSGPPGPLLVEVKRIAGARYDAGPREWLFPLTLETAAHVEAWPKEFKVTPELMKGLAQLYERASGAMEASRATDADLDLPVASQMFPFQRAGVAYAVEHERVIIGDDMGLGKTVQALATIEHEDAYPALVVVPAVVKLNWMREANRWLPHRSVEVVNGRKVGEVPAADYVVVNYDVLAAWSETFRKVGFKAVVFDESHYLKNPKANRTKAAKAVAAGSRYRLLLTGTPILNRPVELVAQLDVLGRLRDFGGARTFQLRYCDAHMSPWGWDASGASNLPELHSRLRSTCLVRRTKDQVLSELPAKVRASVPMELSDIARYRKVEADLKVWLKQRILEDEAFWASLASSEDADVEATIAARRKHDAMRRAEALVKVEALRQTVVELKLEAVQAWVDDFLDSGRKLVAFAHHRSTIASLAERYAGRVVVVSGDTPADQRQAAVDAFQTDPEVQLFLGNIQAAGVGITLTAASDVAFVELPWRPGDLSQAEDRCHRIGQEDSVTCWYLLAAGTIEERIAGLLDQKRAIVDAATDGKAGVAVEESIQNALLSALEKEE